MRQRDKIHCDFCGKSQDDVAQIVDEGRVAICDACADLCVTIADAAKQKSKAAGRLATLEARVAALEALNGKGTEK